MTVDSHLSWTPHIRGETWRPKGRNEPGVVHSLTTKVTAVRRLMWAMTASQLRQYVEGTVQSVIQYCLPVYANSWGVGGRGEEGHMSLCTKEDIKRLQVLQNKALRCLVKRQEGTSWDTLRHMGTGVLARKTGILSVNQIAALATLTMLKKMMDSGKPRLVVERLRKTKSRHQTLSLNRPSSHQLKMTRESFMERAIGMWNIIPVYLKSTQPRAKFKVEAKKWVRMNVPAKPD